MPHIISGHGPFGNRGGPNKDRFPWWMTSPAIEKAIREAYSTCKKLETQGVRVHLIGDWLDYKIEMWFNMVTETIESAWPKY